MNYSYYKYCMVPHCKNTSKSTPNKLFIYVPNRKEIRIKWLTVARRSNARNLSPKATIHFCEDHFDLPNDMVNYMEYRVMGRVSQVRMKPGCIPSKFGCQEDRRKRTCSSTERPYSVKKRRRMTIAECLSEKKVLPDKCTQSSSDKDTSTSDTNQDVKVNNSKTANKAVQVKLCSKFRSKAIQTLGKADEASSPLRPLLISRSTSP